jgi:hypothetical protein
MRDRHGCQRGAPAGIEREVRDDLGNLARLDAVIERELDLLREARGVLARDQRGDRDQAAVARREVGALPQVAGEALAGIAVEGGATLRRSSEMGGVA